jgi:mRNA-degrading endonuclease toxin of MazEF toxin-antitoxin module
MATELKRGSIWMYKFKKADKLRPVLILSRQDVIGLIDTVIVAPITTTIYGFPAK